MLKHYSIADTFGITAPASMKVEGFEPSQNVYVPLQKSYVFRKDQLRDVLAFLGSPSGDGLYLTGPCGSGKTSLLEQVAARLQWGVHTVTGHGRLELNDLLQCCRDSGIETVGIGLGIDVSHLFPKAIAINDFRGLRNQLFELSKTLLMAS